MTFSLIWDGEGLCSPYSGIGNYGFFLKKALEKKGVFPEILFHRQGRWISPWLTGRHIQKIKKPTICHGLANTNIPLSSQIKTARVLTIHDLIPLRKDAVSLAFRLQFQWLLKKALEKADKIICISPWTKNDLEEHFPKISNVQVIPSGWPENRVPVFPQKTKHPAAPWQVLYVARHEPYKRLELLLELASKKTPFHWHVVTDKKGAKLLGKSSQITVHEQMPQKELLSLYDRCHVYAHLSLWEGFGLPIVEALSRGLPVVATTGSTATEHAPFPLIFSLSPHASLKSWTDAIMEQALRGQTEEFFSLATQHRKEQPSWGDTAARMVTLYEDTL